MSRFFKYTGPFALGLLALPNAAAAQSTAHRAPSVQEVEALARRMVTAAYSGDDSAFRGLFDLAELRKRSLARDSDHGRRLDPGTQAPLPEDLYPWSAVSETLEAGGDLRFLRAWIDGDAVLAQFRLTLFLGFDYHTYRFEADRGLRGMTSQQRLRIVDVHLLSRGEQLSATCARRSRLGEREQEDLERLRVYLARGDAEGGLAYLHGLGPEQRSKKDFHLLKGALIGLGSGEEGELAARELRTHENSAIELVHSQLVHGYHLSEDHWIEPALDRLQLFTKDRAFCEYFRGNLDLRRERWKEAQRHYARALMIDSGYEDPLWDLIQVYRATQNNEALAAVLERLVVRYGYQVEDLVHGDEFKAFIASDSYREWMKRRAQEMIR